MNLEWSVFPSLHHCKEGRLRRQQNGAKPPKQPQPGWFSFWFSIGKPPRPRDQRKLRDILLLARPPLLAVMQGGEYARFLFVHTFYERRFSAVIDRRYRISLRRESDSGTGSNLFVPEAVRRSIEP